jgi:hypothetical protein
MAYRSSTILLVVSLCLGACSGEPVSWGNISYRHSQLGDPDARSAIMSANMPAIPGVVPCIQSVRNVGAPGELFRSWWSTRADSSVVLWLQRSGDAGKTWQPAVEVDSRDKGRRGCKRPAPGIFYDSANSYVHLVYFIEGSDGAGVFFSHSMDNGRMFHSPVPVVFGSAPSVAAVTAHGDSVVVVFEDPNSIQPRIGITLSHTTGHIFDRRAEVTPEEVPAVAPWVALRHDTITVWWKTADRTDSSGGAQVGYRTGVWR